MWYILKHMILTQLLELKQYVKNSSCIYIKLEDLNYQITYI